MKRLYLISIFAVIYAYEQPQRRLSSDPLIGLTTSGRCGGYYDNREIDVFLIVDNSNYNPFIYDQIKYAILNFIQLFSYNQQVPIRFGLYFTSGNDGRISINDGLNPTSIEILLEHNAPLNARGLNLAGHSDSFALEMNSLIPRLRYRGARFFSLLFTGFRQQPLPYDIQNLNSISDELVVIPIGEMNAAISYMAQFTCR